MKNFLKKNVWDALSVFYISLTIIFLIIKWYIYPIFIDIYYHIAAMQGYNLAGGITLNAYWEYAPFGRVQLYPPLLHLFMLSLLKLGIPITFIAQFISFVMFPLTLIVLWLVLRGIFNKKTAFFSVILLGSMVPFLWQSAVTSAASLTQILGLIAFYSIEKDKKIATPIILTLLLYSHIAIPYFYLVSFLVYAFFRKERRKLILVSILISLAAFSPWLIHLLRNIQYLHPNNALAQKDMRVPMPTPVYLFLWGFGAIGAFFSVKNKNKYLWPLILLVILIPIAFFYPNRFWDVHSFIPLSILSSFGIYYIYIFLTQRNGNAGIIIGHIILFTTLFIVLLTIPVANVGRISSISLRKAVIPALIKIDKNNKELLNRKPGKGKAASILNKRNISLATFIKLNSKEGDTIYIPNGALADFTFALSGRAVSSGMLKEVQPYKRPLPQDCTFFVIQGNVDGLPPGGLQPHFVLLRQVAGYTIFKNKFSTKSIPPPKPIIPNWILLLIIYGAALIAGYDMIKNKT